jgi:hypothetical protein
MNNSLRRRSRRADRTNSVRTHGGVNRSARIQSSFEISICGLGRGDHLLGVLELLREQRIRLHQVRIRTALSFELSLHCFKHFAIGFETDGHCTE